MTRDRVGDTRIEKKKPAEIYCDGSTSPYFSSVRKDRIEFALNASLQVPELFHVRYRIFRNYAGRTSHYHESRRVAKLTYGTRILDKFLLKTLAISPKIWIKRTIKTF